MSKKANPEQKDWHPAEVVAALRMTGTSLRRLGVSHGYSPTSLKNVLVTKWPKAEQIVASALGMHPEQIWPSRYQERPTASQVLRTLRITPQFSALNVTDASIMTDSRSVV